MIPKYSIHLFIPIHPPTLYFSFPLSSLFPPWKKKKRRKRGEENPADWKETQRTCVCAEQLRKESWADWTRPCKCTHTDNACTHIGGGVDGGGSRWMVLRIRGARDESFRNEWLRERQIKKGSKKNKKGKYNRMEKEGGSVAGLKERERVK